MNEDKSNSIKYAKKQLLETMLQKLNEGLVTEEARLIRQFDHPKLPSLFIVGLQRSGTTLLTQLLLKYAEFGYINNLIARFWQAPYQGTIFARSFTPSLSSKSITLQSDLGYTEGYEGPHEFSYFWRKWFPEATFEGTPVQDKSILVKTVAALESEWAAPMLFKNVVTCSRVISELSKLFPKSIFLHIERNPFFVAQSTYRSRIKLFGNPNQWFGFRPPEYLELKEIESPWEQITAQLYFGKKHIENSLSKISTSRKITIQYEDLIQHPKQILEKVSITVKDWGYDLSTKSRDITALRPTNQIFLDTEAEKALRKALNKYNF